MINKNQINIYKQLIEKERKHLNEEKTKKDEYVSSVQSQLQQVTNQLTFLKEESKRLESDIRVRDECEAKINKYVEELISQNK